MIAGDYTPLEVGRAYRCDANLNLTSAEVARIRLHGIVLQDRERAQEGWWNKVLGARFGYVWGGAGVHLFKARYRWQARR